MNPFLALQDSPITCMGCKLHRPVFLVYHSAIQLCYDCKTEMHNMGMHPTAYLQRIIEEEGDE